MDNLKIALLVLAIVGFSWLWWVLFKKMISQQRLSLRQLDKQIELSIRNKGVVGSLRSKKLFVLGFWAIVVVGLVTITERLFAGLF